MTTSKEILSVITESENYSKRICDLVKSVVCKYYELPVSIFDSKSRIRNVIKAKQTSVHFMRKLLPNATLIYIGKECRYDHCSVIHCIKNIRNLLEIDKETQTDIVEITRIIEIEQSAIDIDGDIEKSYHFVNMNDCISIKLQNNKDIVLAGFTLEEAKAFIKFNQKTMKGAIPVPHSNTNLHILEKKQTDDEK